MKKIIYTFMLVSAFVFTSCEEEIPIYDGAQTLAYFAETNVQLSVPALEASNMVSVPVNVSTLSSSDRTITVSIVEADTEADPAMYSFNTSITVPANTYFTTLDITGFQQGLSESGDNLVLKIDGIDDGGAASPFTLTVNIIKTCPFDISNFYGTYETTSQVYNPASNAPGPGPVVTATAGPEDNLILLTDIFAPGRQAMIELDNSDPDNPVIKHRSFEFGAIYQGGTSVGDLFTTEEFATGVNSFNSCTSGIQLNYLRTNGTTVYNWPYIVELAKQ